HQIAEELHATFGTRGVTLRLVEPALEVSVGEVMPMATSTIGGDAQAGDDMQAFSAPIGRSANPLGEVRLEGRYNGAFGVTERQWLTAFLRPIAAVLRAR